LYNNEEIGMRRVAATSLCASFLRGAIAQLGERIVRNDEVVGSIPTSSTKESTELIWPRAPGLPHHSISIPAL
jgi:hypothetical protein